jgi:hypothetical protein
MRAILMAAGLGGAVALAAPAMAREPAQTDSAVVTDSERYDRITECKAAVIVFRQVRQFSSDKTLAINRELYMAAYEINAPKGVSWEQSAKKLTVDSAVLYDSWRVMSGGGVGFIKKVNEKYRSCALALPESAALRTR